MSLRTFMIPRGLITQNNKLFCYQLTTRFLISDNMMIKNIIVDAKYNGMILYVNNGTISYKSDYEDRIYKLEQIIKTLTNINL
jgi:hypothetical protein